MAEELRKPKPGMTPARVPGTGEVASRDNDVVAGDDDLAERKTENVRVPGDTAETAHRRPQTTPERGEQRRSDDAG
jgi:hypothetical protein